MYSYLSVIKICLSAWWARECFVFLSGQNAVNQKDKVPAGCQSTSSVLFPEIKTNVGLGYDFCGCDAEILHYPCYHFCFLLFSHFNLISLSCCIRKYRGEAGQNISSKQGMVMKHVF